MRQSKFKYTIPYIVEPHDTLAGLARRYNSSSFEIAALNGLESHRIRHGQRLEIPLEHSYYHYYHTVRPAESIEDIAARYHARADDITEDNLSTTLIPGDELVVHEVYVKIFCVCAGELCIREELKKIDYPIDDIRKVALRELFLKLSEFTGQNVYLRNFTHENELATIDVANLRIKRGTGSAVEEMVLVSIVKTLSLYKEIKFLDILIDGSRTETMNGHMLLSKPLPVST
ncbi:MAG: LysM peptidoglycan-binding domain-containing protein [Bacillota bacterium]